MIETTFDEVFTFEKVYAAHMRGRMAKRDKKPLVKFETATLYNLYYVYEKLLNGNFKISGYNHFTVHEPKRREIQTLHYGDRVIQHVICDEVLSPYFSKRAVIDNAVCQIGKGTHFALERFEKSVRKFVRTNGSDGYFLKCDVLKYFPAIPHDKLKQVFCKEIRDARLKNLLEHVIDSYHTDANYLKAYGYDCLPQDDVYPSDSKHTGRGVPIGNQTSQVFGMYFLNGIDRLIKEKLRIKIYSRYMDDFIMVHKDKAFLQSVLAIIREEVAKLGLKLNSKTQIFPMKNGVTYLGFRYFVTANGKLVKVVRTKTKRRLRSRAKLLKRACIDGIIDPERVRCSLAAFHGHLSHAQSYKLERSLNEKLKGVAHADGR